MKHLLWELHHWQEAGSWAECQKNISVVLKTEFSRVVLEDVGNTPTMYFTVCRKFKSQADTGKLVFECTSSFQEIFYYGPGLGDQPYTSVEPCTAFCCSIYDLYTTGDTYTIMFCLRLSTRKLDDPVIPWKSRQSMITLMISHKAESLYVFVTGVVLGNVILHEI